MTAYGYAVIAAVLLLAAGLVLWDRRRTRRIMENLNRMLELAMQGDFTEKQFDESLLSAVETRLAHYLAAATTSARNVQAEKDKLQALISDISHQTKTPISNILLYTQLLSEQALPEESRTCVSALKGQAAKLQGLIDALVKTSRLESGVIALHPAPGPLAPMLASAVSQLAPKAEAKGVQIIQEAVQANAVFDPKWTEEAVYNLLDNAVKYTPAGGAVHIGVAVYPMFCAISVSDTGPGISEDEQPRVFRRFYRGLTHQTEEGVGIGLYLVRRIAERQGGYVKVSSRPGAGSTFSLYLPGA